MTQQTSGKKPTKQERREAARQQALKIREAQKRRERRNRFLLIGGVVVFVALVAVAVFAIVSAAYRSPGDVDPRPAGSSQDGAVIVGAGGVGSESAGAPEVQVYLDFSCPYCAMFEQVNAEALEELTASGAATVKYYPISILDTTSDNSGFSTRAANATAAVADLSPEHFLDFVNGLFTAQGPSGGGNLSDEQIAEVGASVGVPEEVTATFAAGEYTDWIRTVTRQAARDGNNRTPTIYIDGEAFTGWQTEGALAEAVAAASGSE